MTTEPDAGACRILVDITAEDRAALLAFIVRRAVAEGAGRYARLNRLLAIWGGGIAIGLAWSFTARRAGVHFQWQSALLVLAAVVLAWAVLLRQQQVVRRALRPAPGGPAFGKRVLTLSSEGIHVAAEHAEGVVRWSGVRSVHDMPEYIFVRIDTCDGFVIPKRNVDAGELATALRILGRYVHA